MRTRRDHLLSTTELQVQKKLCPPFLKAGGQQESSEDSRVCSPNASQLELSKKPAAFRRLSPQSILCRSGSPYKPQCSSIDNELQVPETPSQGAS